MKKQRFKKIDWIRLGQSELARSGPEAVKLEAICEAAALTRGSFYHHFDDHETFLIALAQNWFETQTVEVANTVDATAGAADQGAMLTDAALAIDFKLEIGMRELARRLPCVKEIVTKADKVRHDVLTDIYKKRFHLDDETAKAFAYLEYAAFSGIILIDPEIDEVRQRQLASLYERAMVSFLGERQ